MVPMKVSCCDRESSEWYEASCCSESFMNPWITSWIWCGNDSLSACSGREGTCECSSIVICEMLTKTGLRKREINL